MRPHAVVRKGLEAAGINLDHAVPGDAKTRNSCRLPPPSPSTHCARATKVPARSERRTMVSPPFGGPISASTSCWPIRRLDNKSFSQRLSGTALQDAILNAEVVLDFTAELTNISLRTKNLDKIEHLFHAYLDSESSKQT